MRRAPEFDEGVALVCIHEAADDRGSRLDAAARHLHGVVDEGGEVNLADAGLHGKQTIARAGHVCVFSCGHAGV